MAYKRLISFDFDDTLFHTPKPEEGEKIWKEKTGTDWPYSGWWGRPESIDPEIFHIPLNQWVYKKYLEAVSDPDNYVILATGRLKKKEGMSEHIQTILNQHNLSFDEVHLNWGGDTYNFKTKLFEEKIEELGVHEFVMYDDRHEHLVRFEEWAAEHRIDVKVVDVVNKKETIFSNNI
jgi:FMN phosphatase YigB (HAD superfamily)